MPAIIALWCSILCFTTITTFAQQSPDLSQGLVLYLPLDGSCYDTSPSSNRVIVHGQLDFQAGVQGQCAVFDGESYLTIEDCSALHYNHFTYCAWICPLKRNWAGRIFEKGSNNSSWLYVQNHLAQTGFFDEDYRDVRGRSVIPTDKWTFVSGSYNGEDLCIYVNGELESIMRLPGKLQQTKEPLFIGWKGRGIPPDQFVGGLDELRVYNRALTDEEVRLLYKQSIH